MSNRDCPRNWQLNELKKRTSECSIACEKFCDNTDGIVSQFMHAKSCHRRRRNHWQAPGAKNTLQEVLSTPTPSPCERTMRPRDSTHCASTCQYTRREEIRDVLDHFSIDKENVWYVRKAERLETGDRKRLEKGDIART